MCVERSEPGRDAFLSVRLLTDNQLQEELQVGRVYLYHRRKEGMPYYRLGSRTVRYNLSEVMEWLERRKTAPGANFEGKEV